MTDLRPASLHPDTDPWRLNFHISAPRGLVNDPNGLIHWQGRTHVFFQLNPQGCNHANKAWGHVASTDLAHWQRLPTAISPTDPFDSHGCYSGSAVTDENGDMVLVYTGNVRNAAGERETYQCLARSTDGVHFDKLGPVIHGPLPGHTAHFRDPKVWRQDGAWWMVLGAQTEALQGTVLLLRSDDLSDWQLVAPILTAGRHGYMCECPDLFDLDGQSLLLFSEQRAAEDDRPASNIAGWVAGEIDLPSGTYRHGSFQRLDHGRDFYAPQSFLHPDGRRIMLGWMGLPEQDSAPSIAQGWFHCLTVPRELRMINGRLCQQPVDELSLLRGAETRLEGLEIRGRLDTALRGDSHELELSGISGALALELRADADGQVLLTLEPGRIRLAERDATGRETLLGSAELPQGAGHSLRILTDRSSIEVFVDQGEVVLSARIYPGAQAQGIALVSEAGARLAALSFWPMRSAWDNGQVKVVTTHPATARVEEVTK